MFKLCGRGVSLIILSGAAMLTLTIVLFLMAVVLMGEKPVIDEISCRLGFSEECLRHDLREERKRLEELKARHDEMAVRNDALAALNAQMTARNADLEALSERLSSLDHASSSYVVFYEARWKSYTISTGHTYASLLDPNALTKAHCYVFLDADGAGSRQVHLGDFIAGGTPKLARYSRAELRGTGVVRSDITAMQQKCRWPTGAS